MVVKGECMNVEKLCRRDGNCVGEIQWLSCPCKYEISHEENTTCARTWTSLPVPHNMYQPKASTWYTCVQGMDILGKTMSGEELYALNPQVSFQKEPRIWRLCNQCQQGSPTFYCTKIVCHWRDDLWIHTASVRPLVQHELEKRKQCENLSFMGSMNKEYFILFLFSES